MQWGTENSKFLTPLQLVLVEDNPTRMASIHDGVLDCSFESQSILPSTPTKVFEDILNNAGFQNQYELSRREMTNQLSSIIKITVSHVHVLMAMGLWWPIFKDIPRRACWGRECSCGYLH